MVVLQFSSPFIVDGGTYRTCIVNISTILAIGMYYYRYFTRAFYARARRCAPHETAVTPV